MVTTADVNGCEDLRGKVVGVDEVGGFAEVLTKMYYTSCGLTQEDVTYGNFPGAEGQAMAQGQSSSGVLHIDEAQGVMEQFPDAGLKSVVNLWDVVPDWHYAGFAAPESILQERRDAIVAFTAANIAANRFMTDTANKEAVLDTAEEVTGLDREILSQTYDTFIEDELFPDDNGYPQEMVDFTADQQVKLGNITEDIKPTYEQLVDTTIYDDALALYEEVLTFASRRRWRPTITAVTGAAPSPNIERRRRGECRHQGPLEALRAAECLRQHQPARRRIRIRLHPGAQRLRQDHAAAHRGRHRAGHRWRCLHQW